MRLIENWRQAWRFHSVQLMALLAALQVVWAELPPEVKELVPADWQRWIVAVLAVAAILARVKDQGLSR